MMCGTSSASFAKLLVNILIKTKHCYNTDGPSVGLALKMVARLIQGLTSVAFVLRTFQFGRCGIFVNDRIHFKCSNGCQHRLIDTPIERSHSLNATPIGYPHIYVRHFSTTTHIHWNSTSIGNSHPLEIQGY